MKETSVPSLLLLITNIGLSARVIRVLSWHKIESVHNLCMKTEMELFNLGKIGPSSVEEIKNVLTKHGKALASK